MPVTFYFEDCPPCKTLEDQRRGHLCISYLVSVINSVIFLPPLRSFPQTFESQVVDIVALTVAHFSATHLRIKFLSSKTITLSSQEEVQFDGTGGLRRTREIVMGGQRRADVGFR